ncbi:ArnT family glycosyltransferase [Anaerosinus sp.]|uniref:ArnT family glycosyltransferase n=1 Tax=Selenobaculum sp. TaxID=3074374 RepID=UPI003AB8D82C
MSTNKNISIGIMIIIAAITIFSNLSGFPLLDPDEPVYAETPKEMILSNDFLSPKIYGEYWYDKPPMYYWLVAMSYQVFGINDFAARFPSAFLSLLSIIAIYFYGKKLFNHKVGIYSALILVTSIEFFYLGKAAVTDITLNFCLMVSLFAFLSRQYYTFYIFAGLAVLTKGPIGLFFPGVIVFLYLVCLKKFHLLSEMKILSGSIIFCLVALPWYIYMYSLHGSAFIDSFLGFHNITRFTSPEHPSGLLWYYYLPVLLVGFFPWITLLFQSIYKSFSDSYGKFDHLLFLNLWAVIILLFFSISKTKLVSYILPMFPALAMLVGWYLDKLTGRNYFGSKRSWGWIGCLLFLSATFVYGCTIGIKEMPQAEIGFISLASTIILMCLVTIFFLLKRNIEIAFKSQVVGMMIFSTVLVNLLFPKIAPDFTSQHVSNVFLEQYDGTSDVYISKFLRPGISFYSGIYGNELVFSPKSIPDLEKVFTNKKTYFILRDIDYDRLPQSTINQLTIINQVDNKLILVETRFIK